LIHWYLDLGWASHSHKHCTQWFVSDFEDGAKIPDKSIRNNTKITKLRKKEQYLLTCWDVSGIHSFHLATACCCTVVSWSWYNIASLLYVNSTKLTNSSYSCRYINETYLNISVFGHAWYHETIATYCQTSNTTVATGTNMKTSTNLYQDLFTRPDMLKLQKFLRV
jgi:hypothetical protein